MIEALQDLPPGVTGVRVSGRVSGEELREFRPTWEKLLETDEIRFVEVIESDYAGFGSGGLLEDWKLSWGSFFRHHSAFKRIAVVTDKEWIIHAVHALAWMVPGEIKVFALDGLDGAKRWAASD
jgi:SpoIIAA-like